MIRSYILTFFLIFSSVLNAQTYTGTSTNKYDCSIRLSNDSLMHFMFRKNTNEIYKEFSGKLKKKNDTLFHVSLLENIGVSTMQSRHPDTLYIELDPEIAHELDVIEVEFSNDTRVQLQGYESNGDPISVLRIPIDKNIFNDNKGYNKVTVTINRKNFERNDFFRFKISYGSSASITKGEAVGLDLIIKNDVVYSVELYLIPTGHFRLKKKK